MTIQKGFNDKPTTIKIHGREDGKVEVWIEQTGLPEVKETLAYATLEELLELRVEVNQAIKEATGSHKIRNNPSQGHSVFDCPNYSCQKYAEQYESKN